MAVAVHTFKGKAAWLSTEPKFTPPVWSMSFYPQDAATRKAIKETGIKNKVQEDDGERSGIEGLFYTLRSKEPYAITDNDGNTITDRIANGAEVTVELEVETFTSKVHGPQARSKIARVLVSKYEKYEPEMKTEAQAELPA